MITVQPIGERDHSKVRVQFSMPALACCGCLYLIGWFEEWHESVYRMQLNAESLWTLTLELEPGREYQYCFRTDDGRWLCDPDAPLTAYSYGSMNSFVVGQQDIPMHSS